MTTMNSIAFSAGEYARRLSRVRETMAEREIDVLLVDQTELLAYLTGYAISENMYRACLVPLRGDPVAVLRTVDTGPFVDTSWLDRFVGFSDWEDPVSVIASTIRSNGWAEAAIGIDEHSYCLTLRRFKQFMSLLPSARFVDFDGALEVLRASKSPEEIAYLRRASQIADLTVEGVVKHAGVGKTCRDAADIAHRVFMTHGADSSRPGIFTIAEGDAFLHGGMTKRPLADGDILHMEVLPMVNGYGARLMRPAIVSPKKRHYEIAARLLEFQDRQFAAMKPGESAADIDAILRKPILEAGLRKEYVNVTGYTLGHYPTSTPRTSDFTRVFLPNATWKLEQGMVFHMYVSAAGIAFSETVLVTETGAELLTRSPRQLFAI